MTNYIQICDGVSSLVHSATMSDIDQLDWRPPTRDTTRITIHDNIIHHHHHLQPAQEQEETTFGPPDSCSEGVQASSSMFTIITTPLRKGRRQYEVSRESYC